MKKNELRVTTLEELKEKAKGELVELPGWGEEPFVCRLKRVSMLYMVKAGKIPNTLLTAAQEVFMDGAGAANSKIDFEEMSTLLTIFVDGSLVEPTAEQLKEIGLELTDEQKIAIFNYTQRGADALKKFRKNDESTEGN